MPTKNREPASKPCSVLIDELIATTSREHDDRKLAELDREFQESATTHCAQEDVDRLLGLVNGEQFTPMVRGWAVVFLGYVARTGEQQRDRIYSTFRERLHDPREAEVVHKWILASLLWLWNYRPELVSDLAIAYERNGIIMTRARIVNTVADLLERSRAGQPPDAVKLLRKALGHDYREVRIPALRGIRVAAVEPDAALVRELLQLAEARGAMAEEAAGFSGTTELVTLVADLSQHERRLAIEALGSLVGLDSLPKERRDVVELLERFVTREPDRALARTAAQALNRLFGSQDAAKRLIEAALRTGGEKTLKNLAEGLREIDEGTAVRQLKERLRKRTADRTQSGAEGDRIERRLLEEIGGREAVSWLMNEQAAEYSNHVEKLKETLESDTMKDLEYVKRNMRSSHIISVCISLGLAVLGVGLVILAGILLYQQKYETGAAATVFAGLGSLVAAFFTGPMRRLEQSVIALTKATMATHVFSRQMRQIDTAFLHGLEDESMSTDDIVALLRNTASAAQVTVQMVEPGAPAPVEQAAPERPPGNGGGST